MGAFCTVTTQTPESHHASMATSPISRQLSQRFLVSPVLSVDIQVWNAPEYHLLLICFKGFPIFSMLIARGFVSLQKSEAKKVPLLSRYDFCNQSKILSMFRLLYSAASDENWPEIFQKVEKFPWIFPLFVGNFNNRANGHGQFLYKLKIVFLFNWNPML